MIPPILGNTPRIGSLLIKPASALCNLDCSYCFYLDRATDPYQALPSRTMTPATQERMVQTFLAYSYPNSVFAFQGGEPTLAGLPFFRKLVELETQYGRPGHNISNALQTNGMLIDEEWCGLFKEYNWLIGISMDGPAEIHDAYRVNKAGHATWKRVMQSIETMQKHKVEFNVLCVVNQVNVTRPREIYEFFRQLGIDNVQYIPLSEFDGHGNRLPYTISSEEYGRFLCETFDLWWPERRTMRIRFFDNLAEGLAGQKPGSCTMHESCDSYAVVEYNGDVYPCDFFVEKTWKLGNLMHNTWDQMARNPRRFQFAANKSIPHPVCSKCQWEALCHGGCPKSRHAPHNRFEDLDYFCSAYKMVFAKTVEPLRQDVRRLLGRV